jgi:hypothetical protein
MPITVPLSLLWKELGDDGGDDRYRSPQRPRTPRSRSTPRRFRSAGCGSACRPARSRRCWRSRRRGRIGPGRSNAPAAGYLLAQQLLAAGERVLDVQPKLGARVRLLADGSSNKNDPNDARSVAIAALRSAAVRPVQLEDHAAVMKVWAKRRRELASSRTQLACRLHAVLCELIPGGVPGQLYAAGAAAILDAFTPDTAVAAARYELALEFVQDLRRVDEQLRATKKRIATAVAASRTTTTQIFGVGPVVAATVIGEVGDIARFATRDRFAAYNSHRADRGVLRQPQDLPVVPAWQPAPQPRHPHGRGHPDPPSPQ